MSSVPLHFIELRNALDAFEALDDPLRHGHCNDRIRVASVARRIIVVWYPMDSACVRIRERYPDCPVFSAITWETRSGKRFSTTIVPVEYHDDPCLGSYKLRSKRGPCHLDPRKRLPRPGEVESVLLARRFMYSLDSLVKHRIVAKPTTFDAQSACRHTNHIVFRSHTDIFDAYRSSADAFLGTVNLNGSYEITWENQASDQETPVSMLHLRDESYLRVFPVMDMSIFQDLLKHSPYRWPGHYFTKPFSRIPQVGETDRVKIRWVMASDGRPVGYAFRSIEAD